jgi:hypothetical protein
MVKSARMTREDALKFQQRWQLVNDFIAEESRNTQPEIRFQQLRTMVATAHRLGQSEIAIEAVAEVRERWRRLKELHASS